MQSFFQKNLSQRINSCIIKASFKHLGKVVHIMATQSIYMRFPGGLSKALTLSYDDAVEQDFRLIDIMTAHGLKGTFNISSYQYIPEGYVYPPEKKWGQRMTMERATELYSRDGIEHALHAYTHPHLETMSSSQIAYEIIKNRESLEAQFGDIVRGMAYPDCGITRSANNVTYPEVKQYLKGLGITYARTLNGDNNKFEIPTDWHAWVPTAHHNNPKFMEWAEEFLNPDENRKYKFPMLFYVWGHSYEFDRNDNWDYLDEICEKLSGKDDVWYATNGEIYEYVNAYYSLVMSADESIIYNPTLHTIWFSTKTEDYKIEPGETIYI